MVTGAGQMPAAVSGMVTLAPVADLALAEELNLNEGSVQKFLGGSACHRTDLDPVSLPSPRTPVRIVHGDEDRLVPLELSRRYSTAHPEVVLVPLSGTTHFDLVDPESTA